MAIYHLSVQRISRGQGKSAVGAAAYRAGEKLENERDGMTHDYARKTGVEHKEILAPENAPEWAKDREKLWNEVERAEKRKDANTAREFNIALPVELSREKQVELLRDYAKEAFISRGMVADCVIHDTGEGNPHAHIMITTRAINEQGFESQKIKNLDDVKNVEKWREQWAEIANKHLERAGMEQRIDHRSYEEQGIEKTPTVHLGVAAAAMERREIETELGNKNREAQEANKNLERITKKEKTLEKFSARSVKRSNRKEQEQTNQVEQEYKTAKVVLLDEYRKAKEAKEQQQQKEQQEKTRQQDNQTPTSKTPPEATRKPVEPPKRYKMTIDTYDKHLNSQIDFLNKADSDKAKEADKYRGAVTTPERARQTAEGEYLKGKGIDDRQTIGFRERNLADERQKERTNRKHFDEKPKPGWFAPAWEKEAYKSDKKTWDNWNDRITAAEKQLQQDKQKLLQEMEKPEFKNYVETRSRELLERSKQAEPELNRILNERKEIARDQNALRQMRRDIEPIKHRNDLTVTIEGNYKSCRNVANQADKIKKQLEQPEHQKAMEQERGRGRGRGFGIGD